MMPEPPSLFSALTCRRLLPLLALALLVTFLSIKSDIDPSIATLWVVDYPGEFIKRGLVGEWLALSGMDSLYTLDAIDSLSKASVWLVAVLLALFVAIVYRDNPWLACGVLLGGFSIQQFGYDIGRFDPINQALVLVAICLLCRSLSWLMLAVVMVLGVVMLAIHEASALIGVPLVFSVLLVLCHARRQGGVIQRFSPALAYLAVMMTVFVAVVACGKVDRQPEAQWKAAVMEKPVDFSMVPMALDVQGNTLKDNVSMSLKRLLSYSTASRMSRVMLVSAATLVIMVLAFRQLSAVYPSPMPWLLFLPVASVLLLFFLGIDFYRWVAALQLNFFLLLGVMLYTQSFRLVLGKKLLVAWYVLAIYGGPFGITVALPDRLRLLESLAGLFGSGA